MQIQEICNILDEILTNISNWQSLDFVTKKSILAPSDVLDPPVLEIEMGQLNKHISVEENFTE